MKNKYEMLQSFSDYLEKSAPGIAEQKGFYSICQCLGISPDSLNELLRKELGLNGPEILASY